MSDTRFDRIQKVLFNDPDNTNVKLFKGDVEAKERIEKIFTYWVNNPHLPDRKIIAFTMHFCALKKTAAYDYLAMVKQMVGSVRTASKEWYRHMVIEMSKAAYQMAVAKRDPKSMALAADKIGKYAKLDKDDLDSLPWEQINPPNFEPTPDVTILGLEATANTEQKRNELRKKYLAKYDPKHFQEAEVIDENQQIF